MLHLYTGNHLTRLADALGELLATPLSEPLRAETILVQSQGMQHWLSMRLAARLGVAANIDFPFPNAFAWQLLRQCRDDLPESSFYDRHVMLFRIMELFDEMGDRPAFGAVRSYLADDPEGIKRYQLAARTADLFDQYIVFRPDLIEAWDRKARRFTDHPAAAVEAWQAELWHALAAPPGHRHRAALRADLKRRLETDPAALHLPQRVSVFGISTLPPFHLDLFEGLARVLDVHLFVMAPCRAFWELARSRRTTARAASRQATSSEELVDAALIEHGNELLLSLGQQTQEFTALIPDGVEHTFYDPPARNDLLHLLQRDILDFTDRTELSAAERPVVAANDDSLTCHVCHTPLREIEILHDQLLGTLDALDNLAPRDIVVMAPDIERYAPFIEAVFNAPRGRDTFIPFSVADRSRDQTNPVAAALDALFEAAQGRFGITEIVGLVDHAVIRRRFGFGDDDADLRVSLLQRAAIHWGLDGPHRERLSETPPTAANTWRAGLERLLLGFALPPDQDDHLTLDRLPIDIALGEAREAGRLARLIECLARIEATARDRHTWPDWIALSHTILQQAVDAGRDGAEALQDVSAALGLLGQQTHQAAPDTPVALAVFREALRVRLTATEHAPGGYLGGGVTFCNLLPMRGIPFRVVCLLGMNDAEFPRQERPCAFDLLSARRRPGDRSRRTDDRHLFLEALLSARERLIITYQGFDAHDNSARPPSVLLNELFDYIDSNTQLEHAPETPVHRALSVAHPLQPFSPAYVDDRHPRLFTYSDTYGQTTPRERTEAISPFAAPLPPLAADQRALSTERFATFFANPAEAFFRHRLELRTRLELQALQDDEPFVLDPLGRYAATQTAMRQLDAGHDLPSTLELLHADGRIPHGLPGDQAASAQIVTAARYRERLIAYRQEPQESPLEISFTAGSFSIRGELGPLFNGRYLESRCGTIRPGDEVALWVRHLLLNTHRPLQSTYVGRESSLHFHPVDPARAHALLSDLIAPYEAGMSAPLRFFPAVGLAYALELAKSGDAAKAADKACRTWQGNDYQRGESEDPAFELAFPGELIVDDALIACIQCVIDPLLEYREAGP